MFNLEKDIYINETEVKPNRYAVMVLIATVFGVLSCWILTEIGIFRVGKTEMRIGAGVSIVLTLIPIILMSVRKDLRSNPITKYINIVICTLLTLFINTLLNFHATLLLIFPISLAMLYRSKELGIIAVIGSCISTILSPILGYVFGLWDIPLLEELILIGTNVSPVIEGATNTISLLSVGKILLYLGIPRLVLVGCFSVLMFNVIRVGQAHVENQILLNRVSRRDTLTGLYNQNYYNEIIGTQNFKGKMAVVFFDVNGLKALNDSQGHEAGDIMIRRCAESLLSICNDDGVNGFRVGGDEFVLFIENADDAKVNKLLLEWKDNLWGINNENKGLYNGLVCEMASGYMIGDASDLQYLIKEADARMYRNKSLMKS